MRQSCIIPLETTAPFSREVWEAIDTAIGKHHIRILTDYQNFTIKEIPSLVPANAGICMSSIIREAIVEQIWGGGISQERVMRLHVDGSMF